MPSALSKELSKAQQQELERKFLRVVGPAVFLNVISGAMLFTARQAAASEVFKSASEKALFFTRLGSVAALLEFLINPVFGKLSDTIGRRPLIPFGNISTTICRMLLFLNPTKMWPYVVEQLVTVPLVTSFFTTWRASLSDNFEGEAYARVGAQIGVFAGLALIVGPLFAKSIMSRFQVKHIFLLSSFFSAITLVHLYINFEESLPQNKRKELTLSDMQPLSFMQVMNHSTVLRRLMLVTGLQTCTEPRNVNDVFSIYMQNDLKWDWDQINNFVGALGISLVASGLSVKSMMKYFGQRQFTTFSNTCNAISFFSYSHIFPFSLISRDLCMWLGLVFAIPGARKRDAIEAMVMKKGAEAGYGRGFLSGSLFNWRSVINIVGPLVFGTLYAFGRKRNFPGFAGALTVLLAEAIARQLPQGEYDDDEKKEL